VSGRDGRPTGAGFAERLEAVRDRIRSASADPGAVRIVAVTKGFGVDAVVAALAAGLTDVGENYADELVAKAGAVADGAGEGPVRVDGQPVPVWHFLGAVQRNKVPRLVPWVSWWQTVSRVEEGRTIAGRLPGATVLVQVDVARLPGRGGCPPDQVPGLVAALRDQDLDVAGLMAVGPPGAPEASRPGFALVSGLADRLDLPVRSMGMSDDLEVALAEGSTMVRLGRALFGDRPLPDGRR
jgi:PLP dependent protein